MRTICAVASIVLVACLVTTGLGGQKTIDKDFLTQAASCQHAEIEFSKLADKRAASDKVKDFASQMAKDHQANYDKVAQLLKDHKIGVVAGTSVDFKNTVRDLGKLEGAEFDRQYLERIIGDHKKAIRLFEGQVENGKEQDIRDYAKSSLPGMREHLKMAEKLAKDLGR